MTMTLYQIVAVAFIEDVLLISTPPTIARYSAACPVFPTRRWAPQGFGSHKVSHRLLTHIGTL